MQAKQGRVHCAEDSPNDPLTLKQATNNNTRRLEITLKCFSRGSIEAQIRASTMCFERLQSPKTLISFWTLPLSSHGLVLSILLFLNVSLVDVSLLLFSPLLFSILVLFLSVVASFLPITDLPDGMQLRFFWQAVPSVENICSYSNTPIHPERGARLGKQVLQRCTSVRDSANGNRERPRPFNGH